MPAAKAGIKVGDVITAINGSPGSLDAGDGGHSSANQVRPGGVTYCATGRNLKLP